MCDLDRARSHGKSSFRGPYRVFETVLVCRSRDVGFNGSRRTILHFAIILLGTLGLGSSTYDDTERAVLGERVRPLLARCTECHGAEKAKNGLRLDRREFALSGGHAGPAFVSGDPDASELIRRIEADDPLDVMPPSGRVGLAREERLLLRSWIEVGAPWPSGLVRAGALADDVETSEDALHWAYRPVVRHEPPDVAPDDLARNPIDAFVLARLAREGIRASDEAPRHVLVRRLHQDLLGLPPTPEAVQAFEEDQSPDAYERLVDALLASPHFGERWARHWLDRARYADSDGYEKDNPRPNAWIFRDWVIDAINADLPYDEFTIEQLAGDLLPEATPSQRIATAFHRQTLTNREGGIDEEEFRVAAVLDRVDTTGSVWLGLTVGCAQCHDHKFDRFSQEDYYRLYAFFDNADEVDRALPPTSGQRGRPDPLEIARLAEADAWRAQRDAAEAELAAVASTVEGDFLRWAEGLRATYGKIAIRARAPALEIAPSAATSSGETPLEILPDGSFLTQGAKKRGVDRYTVTFPMKLQSLTGFELETLRHPSLPRGGPGRGAEGEFVLSNARVEISVSQGKGKPDARFKLRPVRARYFGPETNAPVSTAIDDDEKSGFGPGSPGAENTIRFYLDKPLVYQGRYDLGILLTTAAGGGRNLGSFRVRPLTEPDPWGDLAEEVRRPLSVLLASPEGDDAALAELRAVFHGANPITKGAFERLAELDAREPASHQVEVAVLAEREHARRTSHVLLRGDFLRPGKAVEPDVPATLPPLAPRVRGREPDRLDLARWLVDPTHPLTSRVAVNQIWEHLFGEGIVPTIDDFGVRGEPPTHPELLDWLASEFIRLDWSRKALLRTIVTSATYRRASEHRTDLVDVDPDNRLLARQSRRRLDAELVRDQFLSAASVLSEKIGGPSVFPPLPNGFLDVRSAYALQWEVSEGEDRYRRGLYTFVKRTAPHPTLSVFDCPSANRTAASRRTSNTPLQALTTLNNTVFHEASQAFADLLLECASSDEERLDQAFLRTVSRVPSDGERERLQDLLAEASDWYREHPLDAEKMALSGSMPDVPIHERAAWVATARVILNLDESLTRQ